MYCNCRNGPSARSWSWTPVVAQQRACHQPCPRSATTGLTRASAQSGPWSSTGFWCTVWTMGICLCARTGMSTTLSMNCNCGTSTVFCAVRTMGISHCITTGKSTALSKTCNCGIFHGVLLHSLDHGDLPLRNDRDVNDLVDELQLRNLHSFLRSQDHGQLTLHNNGQVNNLVQDLQLWNLPRGSAAQSGPWGSACCSGELHGILHGQDLVRTWQRTVELHSFLTTDQLTMGNSHWRAALTGQVVATTLSTTLQLWFCHGPVSYAVRIMDTMSLHKQLGYPSTTLSKICKFGITTGFRTVAPVVAQQRACQQPYPKPATAETPRGSAQPWTVGTWQRTVAIRLRRQMSWNSTHWRAALRGRVLAQLGHHLKNSAPASELPWAHRRDAHQCGLSVRQPTSRRRPSLPSWCTMLHRRHPWLSGPRVAIRLRLQKDPWPSIDDHGHSWTTLRGHPWTTLCGHPWTILCGHPWTILCGHPWTTLCGHPWPTLCGHPWPTLRGHPWTTLGPSVDDPGAIRGRPRVAIRGRPPVAIRGRPPCGHPWTTLCGHPWTTLGPSVDDPVATPWWLRAPRTRQRGGLDMYHSNWWNLEHGCREEHGRQGFCLQSRGASTFWSLQRELPLLQQQGCPQPSRWTATRWNLPQVSARCRTVGTCRCLQRRAYHKLWTKIWELPLYLTTGFCRVCPVGTLSQNLQLWNLHGLLHGLDHGHLSLKNNGHFTVTLSKICNCGISMGFCTVWTMDTCRWTTTGMSGNLVQDLQLWNLHGPSARSGPWNLLLHQQRACQVILSKICNCGIYHGLPHSCPVGTCLSLEIGTVPVGNTVGTAVLVVTRDA